MSKEFSRADRVADLIRKELTLVCQKTITDVRLQFITFTLVKVTKDFSYADIWFTQLENPALLEKKETNKLTSIQLLKKAAPRLRFLLAKKIKLPVMPALRFFYDDLECKSQKLYDLIDRSVQQDVKKRDG